MGTRKWVFILSLLFIGTTLFAMTPKKERIEIRNYSSKNVVVNWEYREIISGRPESNYSWDQTVCGIGLVIRDLLSRPNFNIIRPTQNIVIVEYFPDWWNYDKMDALPFMEKMNSIFKKLEIICNDGKNIITLENLGEKIIKKDRPAGEAATYILEIFDYDLVWRSASEW